MERLLANRRRLRREATDAETVLWGHLRSRRFAGFKFRRQSPCGPFILDFFCYRAKLAIELDGGQHFDPAGLAYDRSRDRFLAARGIKVLRFPTDLVFREREGLLLAIAQALGLET